MKLQLVKLGRCSFKEIRSLVEVYQSRIARFAKIEALELKDGSTYEKKLKEGSHAGEVLVILDEGGKQLSSPELASMLSSWLDDPRIKSVVFLIGGPYGIDAEVKRQADLSLSLSRATLPSDLAWLVTWEQVYRAFTILKGTGYHHD